MKKLMSIALTLGAVFVFPMPSIGMEAMHFTHDLSIYAVSKGSGLTKPEGVACNREGTALIVADTGNGRLVRYSLSDETFMVEGPIKVPRITYPTEVQINSTGDIFVLDGKIRQIVHLGPNGKFKGVVQPAGIPGAAKVVPVSFKLDGADNLYLLDVFSRRVLVLDSTGKFLRQLPFPEDEGGFFRDLTVDQNGTIYLLDCIHAAVFSAAAKAEKFVPFGDKLKEYTNFPTYITTDQGNIFLLDEHGGGIVLLGQDGTYRGRRLGLGWQEGRLYYPTQICFSAKGLTFIADRENNRVQVFTLSR